MSQLEQCVVVSTRYSTHIIKILKWFVFLIFTVHIWWEIMLMIMWGPVVLWCHQAIIALKMEMIGNRRLMYTDATLPLIRPFICLFLCCNKNTFLYFLLVDLNSFYCTICKIFSGYPKSIKRGTEVNYIILSSKTKKKCKILFFLYGFNNMEGIYKFVWAKKGSNIFQLFCEVMIAVCPLTLLKVNLDITVEAYKRQRKKKKHIAEGVELFWVSDKWPFVSSSSAWDWKLNT